jgi:predicted transcriptional regulator
MLATLTIKLPTKMKSELNQIAKKTHLRKSDIVRDAVGRSIARLQFQSIREQLIPEAQSKGIYTDEDIFKLVS